MKLKLLFIVLTFSACTQKKFSGYVKDFDSNKPIENVYVNISENTTQTDSLGYFNLNVNCNSSCILKLNKTGYAFKKIIRKPDVSEKKENDKADKNVIYMFKKESDFSNHINRKP